MIDTDALKKRKIFEAVDTAYKRLSFSVWMVAKACFNDERLIETFDLTIEELTDKELLWIDLYPGRKYDNMTTIAPVYIDGNDVYFLEKGKDDEVKVVKMGEYSLRYSDDAGEDFIVSLTVDAYRS